MQQRLKAARVRKLLAQTIARDLPSHLTSHDCLQLCFQGGCSHIWLHAITAVAIPTARAQQQQKQQQQQQPQHVLCQQDHSSNLGRPRLHSCKNLVNKPQATACERMDGRLAGREASPSQSAGKHIVNSLQCCRCMTTDCSTTQMAIHSS